jgi:cyclophilin family peptidyl-prolyl cis-trans isomerase
VYVSFPDENTPVEEYEMQPTIKMAIVEQKHKNSSQFFDQPHGFADDGDEDDNGNKK